MTSHLLIFESHERTILKVLVTGGAGFIGSNLTDFLINQGIEVRIADNFSTGFRQHLVDLSLRGVEVAEGDLTDRVFVDEVMSGIHVVVHLAANADVRFGWDDPYRDIEQNLVVTHNVLQSMIKNGVNRLIFSSTGSVYGEANQIPTPEDACFPRQTSLYGASKSAAEGLISAYCENGKISATVFRFVSILGPRYSHGHVLDFVAQLLDHPQYLRVLGDGTQRKSYLHVEDCIKAIHMRLAEGPSFEVLNLGVDSFCELRDSITWITRKMGLAPNLEFTGGSRGWVGDNPFIYLDIKKVSGLGWRPSHTIEKSVEDTVDWILENPWVLKAAVQSKKPT